MTSHTQLLLVDDRCFDLTAHYKSDLLLVFYLIVVGYIFQGIYSNFLRFCVDNLKKYPLVICVLGVSVVMSPLSP